MVEKALDAIMAQNQCLMNNIDKNLNAIEEMVEVYRYVNDMIRSHNPVLEFDLQRYFPQLFKRCVKHIACTPILCYWRT